MLLLLLVWHALLGVRSIKCRHQSPEWTILSHSYRLIQGWSVADENIYSGNDDNNYHWKYHTIHILRIVERLKWLIIKLQKLQSLT